MTRAKVMNPCGKMRLTMVAGLTISAAMYLATTSSVLAEVSSRELNDTMVEERHSRLK